MEITFHSFTLVLFLVGVIGFILTLGAIDDNSTNPEVGNRIFRVSMLFMTLSLGLETYYWYRFIQTLSFN
jgi:hypothetical protein